MKCRAGAVVARSPAPTCSHGTDEFALPLPAAARLHNPKFEIRILFDYLAPVMRSMKIASTPNEQLGVRAPVRIRRNDIRVVLLHSQSRLLPELSASLREFE
jgi:hypothetical protein